MASTLAEVYLFGDFRFQLPERLLYCRGEMVPLTPKVADTLAVLVQSRGSAVSKEDLLQQLWPDTFVEDHNLTQNISVLRKAFAQYAEGLFIETIPKRGYRFVPEVTLSCPEVIEAIAPAPRLEPAVAAPRKRRGWLWGIAAGLALCGGAAAVIIWRPGNMPDVRQAVAVVGFYDLNGDAGDWRSTALTEMFNTELSATSGLRTISSDSVARMRQDWMHGDLRVSGAYTKETLARIRSNLGCDYVLLGSYLPAGGKLRLDVRLQDARTGEIASTFTTTGEESELLRAVADAGRQLRQSLGFAKTTDEQKTAIRAASPSNDDAVRLYAEGLDLLRRFDAAGAQAKLTEAIAADPNFPLAHSAISSAWSILGFDQRAKAEAKIAFDLARPLAREDRLLVEGRYWTTVPDWGQAIDVYRALWRFYPDNIEYGLLLSAAESASGHASQSLQLLAEMRKLKLPAPDPRLDLQEARADEALGDYRSGADAAARCLRMAQSKDSRWIEARARLEEGKCAIRLADPKKAREDYQAGQKLCSALGDNGCVAEALNDQAAVLNSQGELVQAEQVYQQAVDIEQRIGDRGRRIGSVTGLASIHRSRADMGGAQNLFEEALAISREAGDQRNASIALNNIGNVLNNSGHPDEAKQKYQEALEIAQASGDQRQMAIDENNLAVLAYFGGDLAGSRKKFEEVLDLKRRLGDRSSYAYSLSHYGNVLELQGDLRGARKAFEEQRRIQSSAKEKILLANCDLSLADLDLDEGRPEKVDGPARKIIAEFTTVNPAGDAWRLLALSYLARHDLVRAKDAVNHAKEYAAKTPNIADFKLPIAIVAARVDGAMGNKQSALASLSASIAQARRLHLVALELEARLAMCEIQQDAAQVAELRNDATRLGFAQILARLNRLK